MLRLITTPPGIDRIVMLSCGEEKLRVVVLFPIDQRAEESDDGRAVRSLAQAAARAGYSGDGAGLSRPLADHRTGGS
jgi:hypothetical protein